MHDKQLIENEDDVNTTVNEKGSRNLFVKKWQAIVISKIHLSLNQKILALKLND